MKHSASGIYKALVPNKVTFSLFLITIVGVKDVLACISDFYLYSQIKIVFLKIPVPDSGSVLCCILTARCTRGLDDMSSLWLVVEGQFSYYSLMDLGHKRKVNL